MHSSTATLGAQLHIHQHQNIPITALFNIIIIIRIKAFDVEIESNKQAITYEVYDETAIRVPSGWFTKEGLAVGCPNRFKCSRYAAGVGI